VGTGPRRSAVVLRGGGGVRVFSASGFFNKLGDSFSAGSGSEEDVGRECWGCRGPLGNEGIV
jgi:hypothetical protein